MTNRDDLNDDLSDLLGGSFEPRPQPQLPAGFKPVTDRIQENCPKCGGTGRFTGWSGRTVGDCFKCEGTGKLTFKNAAPARAKAREQAAARKELRALDAVEAWKAENRAEAEWLVATAPRWDVAASLLAGLHKFGSLTEKQMGLVRNGLARDAARTAAKAARVAAAPAVDVSKIETAFAHAVERAHRKGQKGVFKKPLKLRSLAEAVDVMFTPGSAGSQWEGMLFAKTPEGKKLGHIKGGKFHARFECTPVEQAAVLDCAGNPEIAAVAFGKAWSQCAICGQTLLNDGSIERGIGPICAEKFGW